MKNNPNPRSSTQPNPSRRSGFTLIELLVTVTIIAALAALIMVMTRRVRYSALQVNALSSMRQVSNFNTAYSTENNGNVNTVRDPNDPLEGNNLKGIGDAWVKNTFWGRIQPFMFNDIDTTDQSLENKTLNQRLDRLFNSSDADTMLGTILYGARIYHDDSGLPVPFGFNQNLYKWGQYTKTNTFTDQSQVLYATYGFYFFNQSHGQAYVPMPKSPKSYPIYYLENRNVIAAFLDGHVEILQAPIPARKFK